MKLGAVDEDSGEMLLVLYLCDETEILRCKQQINNQRLVAGLIYLDNYDEALESVEEVRRSLLVALIDRKITKYFTAMEGIVKKLENDKVTPFFYARRKGGVCDQAAVHERDSGEPLFDPGGCQDG